ncbi:MAG TPA: DUF4173 domain-containing protein [Drouetiella sp.]
MTVSILILIAALMTGWASDFLFYNSISNAVPNGVSVLLWSLMISLAVSVVAAVKKKEVNSHCLWWLLPVNLSAFAYMWRDSGMLHNIDVYLILFSLVMLSFSLKGNIAQTTGIAKIFDAFLATAVDAGIEAISLLKIDIPWNKAFPPAVRAKVPAVLRGVTFAVPLLVVFCALFWSADATFAAILSRGFTADVPVKIAHTALILSITWFMAGYMRPMFLGASSGTSTIAFGGTKSNSGELSFWETLDLKIGRVELNVVLGLLNVLFLAFVLVQIRYFFGGHQLVMSTAGLTCAEYARKGFFELATVSGLVLPLLLVADFMLPRHKDKFDKIFPIQAAFQILMLFVIMASAIQRMDLYEYSYGLTELRFYVSAFIKCMAVLYAIFAGTVLVGKRANFAFAASIAAFLVVGVLQIANPDRIIVAANIQNAMRGKDFDVDYALSLSSDATTYLAQNVGKLPFKAQKQVAAALIKQEQNANNYSFLSFNVSRADAFHAVHENLPLLKAINTVGAIEETAPH